MTVSFWKSTPSCWATLSRKAFLRASPPCSLSLSRMLVTANLSQSSRILNGQGGSMAHQGSECWEGTKMGWWQDGTVQSGALISGPTHISTTEAFHTASPTPSQRLFTHVHKCCSESSQVHMQQGDLPNVALESSVQLPAFWQAAPACAPNESHLSRIIQLGTGQAKQGFIEASANHSSHWAAAH